MKVRVQFAKILGVYYDVRTKGAAFAGPEDMMLSCSIPYDKYVKIKKEKGYSTFPHRHHYETAGRQKDSYNCGIIAMKTSIQVIYGNRFMLKQSQITCKECNNMRRVFLEFMIEFIKHMNPEWRVDEEYAGQSHKPCKYSKKKNTHIINKTIDDPDTDDDISIGSKIVQTTSPTDVLVQENQGQLATNEDTNTDKNDSCEIPEADSHDNNVNKKSSPPKEMYTNPVEEDHGQISTTEEKNNDRSDKSNVPVAECGDDNLINQPSHLKESDTNILRNTSPTKDLDHDFQCQRPTKEDSNISNNDMSDITHPESGDDNLHKKSPPLKEMVTSNVSNIGRNNMNVITQSQTIPSNVTKLNEISDNNSDHAQSNDSD